MSSHQSQIWKAAKSGTRVGTGCLAGAATILHRTIHSTGGLRLVTSVRVSLYMTLTASNKRSLQEGISTLPDELLRGILTHVDFDTKVQGHAVCRKWNHILGNPCDGDIWAEVSAFTMTGDKLLREKQQQILRYTEWLAARAAGIQLVPLLTEQWQSVELTAEDTTEARFFMERQLPNLLGQLHLKSRQLNISLSTGGSL